MSKWAMLKPAQQKAVGKEFFETMVAAAREYDQVADHQRQTDDGEQTAGQVQSLLTDED